LGQAGHQDQDDIHCIYSLTLKHHCTPEYRVLCPVPDMSNALLINSQSVTLALRFLSFQSTSGTFFSLKCAQKRAFNSKASHLYPSTRHGRTIQSNTNTSVDPRKKTRSLPRIRLSNSTIDQIFGQSADYQTGNKVLYELHRRRVTGSIVDHGLSFKDLNISQEEAAKALQWLRQHYPIDEATAGERYAEQELEKHKAMLSEGFIAKAKRWGLVQGRENKNQNQVALDDSFIAEKARLWREAREKKEQQKKELDTVRRMESEKKAEQYALQIAQQQELLGIHFT
jgi:hypothetical protein